MCKSPISVKVERKDGYRSQAVRCGRCKQCISMRIAEWRFRLEQELLVSHSPYFITLTYNEPSVPWKDGYRVLFPKHLTDYIKRVRFHHDKLNQGQLRYFACGEYGTSGTRRPHYHVMFFNCDDVRLLLDQWTLGFAHISPLRSIASVGYTLKYLHKSRLQRVAGVSAFARMSKGIGRNYVTPQTIEYHNRRVDNCMVSLTDGSEIPVPKYLKEKLYDWQGRYDLAVYLQNLADAETERKVRSIMAATGDSEIEVRRQLYVAPFVNGVEKVLVSRDGQ